MPTANPARRPGATSGYVPVNGLDMYYEIHGDGSPLALFHGAMGTIDSCFAGLLPALAATRQVVAIELQGHGHTADVDRPLSYRQMAADAAALLKALGIEAGRSCRLQHGRWRRRGVGDAASGHGAASGP